MIRNLLTLLLLFCMTSLYSQIAINQSLDSSPLPAGWTQSGYTFNSLNACEGSGSLRDNLWSSSTSGNITTNNYVAASNGEDVAVSYQYRTTEFGVGDGVGLSAEVFYSIDNGSNYISLGTYSASEITSCTIFTTTIPGASVPAGSDFRFRIEANWVSGDFYHYIDDIQINQVALNPPNCDASLTSTLTDFPIDGNLTWSAATGGATGYKVNVGTSTGATDVVNMLDVGSATNLQMASYNLNFSTDYFVTIIPYNINGDAMSCTEEIFTTEAIPPLGAVCETSIEVTAIPYNTTDNTSNYGDDYSGSPGTSCGTTNNYLNGDDVFYSYTADADKILSIELTNLSGTYAGIFIYESCSDVGTSCVGGDFNASSTANLFATIDVVSGNTYYIVISTWASPQSTSYTLDISEILPIENDDCDGALTLTVNDDLSCTELTAGSLVGATASGVDESACSGTENDDVWFSFEATNTTHYISLLNITGGTSDLYHSLWVGECGSLTLVPGSCSDPNSSTATGLAIGETYYLRVYSWSSTPGATSLFDVCIGSPPPPITNDECDGALELTVNSDDECSVVTNGSLIGATASGVDETACLGTENDDVWFYFEATNEVHFIDLLNVSGSPTDLFHSVWVGGCGSLVHVPGSCSDSNSSTVSGLTIGVTYYVRVNSYGTGSGATTQFNVCIGTPPPPPPGDNCTMALDLNGQINTGPYDTGISNSDFSGGTNPFTQTGGNTFNSWNNSSPAYRDVWFEITPTVGTCFGFLSVSTLGSTFDTKIAIYDDCSTVISGNDDFFGFDDGFASLTTAAIEDGHTYYIQVAGYSSSSTGTITLDIITQDLVGAVPNGAGDVTADFECTDAQGWTHYVDSQSGYVLFSIEKNGNNLGWVPMTSTDCTVSAGSGAINLGLMGACGGAFYAQSDHWFVMNRTWDFAPSNQPTTDVMVRSYYTDEDVSDVNIGLSSVGLPAVTETDIVNYKITDGEENLTINVCHADDNGGLASYEEFEAFSIGECSGKYAEYSLDGFSGGGGGAGNGTIGGALPVDLISFTAYPQEKYTELVWEVANEVNLSHYSLERSIGNAYSFNELKRIDATDAIRVFKNYDAIDHDMYKLVYYRLKTIDFDGYTEYSKIINVRRKSQQELILSPNPVINNINLTMNEFDGGNYELKIINSLGQIVHASNITVEENSYVQTISIAELSQGIYYVQIAKDGQAEITKFVKY